MKNIFLVLMLFCVAFAAQAQKMNYDYYVIPPEGMRVAGADMTDFAEGEVALPNGQKLKWRVIYSPKTHKFYNWFFAKPEGMSQSVFENGVNAMTGSEFWDAAILCTYQQQNTVVRCLRNLLDRMYSECRTLGGEHCWINGN